MKRRLTLTIGAIGMFLAMVAPVAASAPEFGCVPPGWLPSEDPIYTLEASPGDENWRLEVRLCQLKENNHVVRLKG